MSISRFLEVRGQRLAYDEVSPLSPRGVVLLLIGLGGNRLGWRWQLRTFGREYRTLALDYRDTGESAPVSQDYAVSDLAQDAAALLAALQATPAHVIGISMGGFVALQLALDSPELVRSLTLVSTSAGGSGSFLERAEQVAALQPEFALPVAERTLRTYAQMLPAGFLERHPRIAQSIATGAESRPQSPQSYARQLRAALGHDVTNELAYLRVPTLIIHGRNDPVIPPEEGQFLAEQIPGAECLLYDGVGHLPPLEKAEAFNQAVLDFLARH